MVFSPKKTLQFFGIASDEDADDRSYDQPYGDAGT
jgi:hypothetical protein